MTQTMEGIERPGAGQSLGGAGAKEGPVLIVDDDPYDALLAESVLDELRPRFPVQILTCGEDLVAYLKGEGLYKDREQFPFPGLVLLDLKMPGMDGFAVLDWLKEHPEYAQVPIIVLSGCVDMIGQVTRAYGQGADAFLPKPVKIDDLQSALSHLKISL
jgi:CheY-like chemotaxis protein